MHRELYRGNQSIAHSLQKGAESKPFRAALPYTAAKPTASKTAMASGVER